MEGMWYLMCGLFGPRTPVAFKDLMGQPGTRKLQYLEMKCRGSVAFSQQTWMCLTFLINNHNNNQ